MNDLPAEIKDRLLIETTRFCADHKVPVDKAVEFVARIGLIIVDYADKNYDENYVEKSMQQIADEIVRDN